MKMCDVHCHILPGVDDGANSIQTSREMLRLASDDGIRAIVCTPHYHLGRGTTSSQKDRAVFENLKRLARTEFPEIQIFLGQENYYTSETLEKLEQGELLTMGESDYVLLEFSHTVTFGHIRDAVYELYQCGYLPIIAHVERYNEIVGKPESVAELVKHGAYIQVNADSLSLGITNPVRRFVIKLLKQDLVHFIASDAHGTKSRVPQLSAAAKLVKSKLGEEKAREIFWENPRSIIKNIEI